MTLPLDGPELLPWRQEPSPQPQCDFGVHDAQSLAVQTASALLSEPSLSRICLSTTSALIAALSNASPPQADNPTIGKQKTKS